ncbi:UNVERIFIED_CONTAM: hypothetical protein FKN15_060999 [Acipenser sinensis]
MDPLEKDQLDEELMIEMKKKKLFQMSPIPALPLSKYHEGMDPLEEDQLDEELMIEMKKKKLFQMSPIPALPLSIWPPQMQTMHTPCPPNAAVHIIATHRIAGQQTGLHLLTIHPLATHSLVTHLPTLLPPHLMLLQNLLIPLCRRKE